METKILLKKVFPVATYVTDRSKKIVAKKATDYEGYEKVGEHYYAELNNYPIYKNQLDKSYIDVGLMDGVYPYEPEELSFEYTDLSTLDSVILQYDEKTNSYDKIERLVQRLSKVEQIEDNKKNNITEYWDISSLTPMQQDEIKNVLAGAVETFEISNDKYTKLEKSKSL